MNVTATRSEWRGGGWWYIEKRQVGESAKCTVSIEKNDNSPSRKYIVFFLLHHHCHGKSSFSVRQTGLDATDMQHGSPSRFVNFSQTSHTTACYREREENFSWASPLRYYIYLIVCVGVKVFRLIILRNPFLTVNLYFIINPVGAVKYISYMA